jgi:hypothetical protein
MVTHVSHPIVFQEHHGFGVRRFLAPLPGIVIVDWFRWIWVHRISHEKNAFTVATSAEGLGRVYFLGRFTRFSKLEL